MLWCRPRTISGDVTLCQSCISNKRKHCSPWRAGRSQDWTLVGISVIILCLYSGLCRFHNKKFHIIRNTIFKKYVFLTSARYPLQVSNGKLFSYSFKEHLVVPTLTPCLHLSSRLCYSKGKSVSDVKILPDRCVSSCLFHFHHQI